MMALRARTLCAGNDTPRFSADLLPQGLKPPTRLLRLQKRGRWGEQVGEGSKEGLVGLLSSASPPTLPLPPTPPNPGHTSSFLPDIGGGRGEVGTRGLRMGG